MLYLPLCNQLHFLDLNLFEACSLGDCSKVALPRGEPDSLCQLVPHRSSLIEKLY